MQYNVLNWELLKSKHYFNCFCFPANCQVMIRVRTGRGKHAVEGKDVTPNEPPTDNVMGRKAHDLPEPEFAQLPPSGNNTTYLTGYFVVKLNETVDYSMVCEC